VGKKSKWVGLLFLTLVCSLAVFFLLSPAETRLPASHEQALRTTVPSAIWEQGSKRAVRVAGGYLVEITLVNDEMRPMLYSYRVTDTLTVASKQVSIGYGSNYPLNMGLAFLFGTFLLGYAALAYRRDRKMRTTDCGQYLRTRPKQQKN